MPPSRHLAVVLVLLVVSSGFAGVASERVGASPRGSPDLSVFVPDDRVSPGEETRIGVFLLNGGSVEVGGSPDTEARITTARNVRVTLGDGNAPVQVRTATRPVGNVPEGVTGPVAFSIVVDEDAAPGTYRIPVRLQYRYTRHIVTNDPANPSHQEVERSVTEYVTIEVARGARFEVVDVASDVRIGGRGTLSLTIRNVGSAAARDVSVVVRSTDAELAFGTGSPSAETFAGSWAPGEEKRVTFDVGVTAGAVRRNYSVAATVNYRDADGAYRRSDERSVGVRPGAEPSFVVANVSTTTAVGGVGTLTLELDNTGGTTVRDATVTVASTDADVRFGEGATAESFAGDWAPGERKRVTYRMAVAEESVRRDYAVEAVVTYDDDRGRERSSEALVTAVRPRPESTFAVDVESSAAVGAAGYVEFAIRNTGPRTVHDATVTVESRSGAIGFGPDGARATTATGTWEPGEEKRVRVRVEVAPDAAVRDYAVTATVAYENDEGMAQPPKALTTALRPGPEQDFAVRNATSDLRVGSTGTVTARIVNPGPRTARDVVVVLAEPWANLTRTPEYAVGDLPPDDAAPVRFTIDVPPGVEPGPRQLAFAVRYRDATGTVRSAYPLAVRADVGPKRDAFAVEPVNASFRVDSNDVLRIRLTNDRGEPVSDVVPTIAPADPLSSDDPTAYVSRLSPGESVALAFHLDVSNDAIPKTHAVSLRVSYVDAAGNPGEAGPYAVPVTVTRPPGTGVPVLPIVVIAIALAVGVGWWWRRREG